MNNNTIVQVVKDGLCTGCGTCIALCPNEAIELTINEKKGIYIPELNEDKCNNCGICFKVCPGHEVDFKALNLEIFGKEPEDILIGNYLNCYIGHATDYDIRYNSASGGLVTQLLIFALENGIIDGALVTRMKKDNPLEPEPFIARTKEELIEASKSKYCPIPANIALKEILESDEGWKFAVVGLPCHIYGIRKAEQINKKLREKIVLHLGIFCSSEHTFSGTEFLLQRIGVKKDDIIKLDYRGEGWPGGMMITLKNGNKKFLPLKDYWEMFGPFFIPTRCILCFDESCELSDISFGDIFLPELTEKDKIGTSRIVSRNKEGEEILQHALLNKKVELNKTDFPLVWQIMPFKQNLKASIFFFKLFRKKVPTYNISLLKPRFSAYFKIILLHSRLYISSKRYLWGLLNIWLNIYTLLYPPLFKFASYCIHKVRQLFR